MRLTTIRVDASVIERVRAAYPDQSINRTVARLLSEYLDHQEARAKGGRARWAGSSAHDRAAAARRAVNARWAKSH